MTDRVISRSTYIRGLIAAIAAISVAAIGFGHSIPLFSILLERYGASDDVIGWNTGTAAIAAVIATPFFPRLIGRIGLKPFLLFCLGLMVLTYLLLAFAGDAVWLWFPLRFLFGFAGAGLFVGSEIWINALAPKHIRGQVIGIYSTCLALGFAAGPFMIELFGTVGLAPFLVGMLIFSTALWPIIIASAPETDAPDAPKGFFSLLPKAPATFLSASIFAGAEAAILTFLPVYALEVGWGETAGTRAVTIYGLGLVALQYLIGRQADRIGYGRSLLICAVLSAGGAVGFTLIDDQLTILYLVLFAWGGFIAGLYTVGLTLLGDGFTKSDLSAANTGFVFMYGVGAIIGPVGAGYARELGGQFGLELFLISALVLYLGLVVIRWQKPLP